MVIDGFPDGRLADIVTMTNHRLPCSCRFGSDARRCCDELGCFHWFQNLVSELRSEDRRFHVIEITEI